MDFELIRILFAFVMLGIASFLDIRKRSVSDILWIGFAVVAGVLYIFDFPSSFTEMITIILSLTITVGISVGIYKSGLFGGADMLCLIVLAAIVPTYSKPHIIDSVLPIPHTVTFYPIASLIVLTNALILSLIEIFINIARNLSYVKNSGSLFEGLEHEPATRKAIALLIGYRMKDQARHSFPIETIVDGKRKFDFGIKSAEDIEYEMRNNVWVMSGQPLLVYMLAGFIIMLFAGDLVALAFYGLSSSQSLSA